MSNEPHVTALELDLLVLGQLRPEDLARLEAHSAVCPGCATRRAEHDEDVRRFRSSVFLRTAPRVIGPRRSPLPWRWVFELAVPVTACALLLAYGHGKPSAVSKQTLDHGTLGIKGPSARVFARRSGPGTTDVVKVNDGDRLAAGDALRFLLAPTDLPYVLIASVDGAGQTSVYYPFHGESSGEVDPKGTVWVPGSIVLDQAPGPERIFFLHSAQPLEPMLRARHPHGRIRELHVRERGWHLCLRAANQRCRRLLGRRVPERCLATDGHLLVRQHGQLPRLRDQDRRHHRLLGRQRVRSSHAADGNLCLDQREH